jgi:hypothetical protein
MGNTDHNTDEKIASAAGQDAPAVVNGPSCPAAFATWWAEYRNKIAKPETVELKKSIRESLQ